MRIKQKWMIVSILIIGCALTSVGCGKAAPALVAAGSCTVVGSGFTTCFDYTGSGYTSATAQTACAGTTSGSNVGTYSAAACTVTSRVGSCTLYSGQATEQIVRYFGGYINSTAATSCSGFAGTYTSG